MSSFSGNTGDAVRDAAQKRLAECIGNTSTQARSIELAVRAEQALFERLGKRIDADYRTKVDWMATNLSEKSGKGFELNRKLLTGSLSPEKWAADVAPEQRPELVTLEDAKARKDVESSEPSASGASTQVKPPQPSRGAPTSSVPTPVLLAQGVEDSATNSSYYFFKSTPTAQAAMYAPKKVDDQTIAKLESDASPAQGFSKWNKGGTWESKDMSAWAKQHLKEALQDVLVPAFSDGDATIESNWTVSGEASVVLIRGKRRPGFEISCSTKWKGSYKGQEAKGKIVLPQFDEADFKSGDYEINVTCSNPGAEHSQVCRRAVSKVVDEIRRRVEKFHEALSEAC